MAPTSKEFMQTLRTLTKEKQYTEAYAVYKDASSLYPHDGQLDLAMGWIVWFDALSGNGEFALSRVKLIIRALTVLAETVPTNADAADRLMHIREKLFLDTLSKLYNNEQQAFVTDVFTHLTTVYSLASSEVVNRWFKTIGKKLASVSLALGAAFTDAAREYFAILQSDTIYYLLARKAKFLIKTKDYEQALQYCQEALNYEGEQESIVHYHIVKASLGLSHHSADRAIQQQAHEFARLHAILYQLKPVKLADFTFYFEYGKVFAFFLMRREHFLCREYAVRTAKAKGKAAEHWLNGVKPITSPYAEGIDAMTDQELENELNLIWTKEAEQYHLL